MSRQRSVLENLGARLRARRKARGLTQQELAETAEIAVETISRLETGRWSNTSIEIAERLARALGLELRHLFDHEDVSEDASLSPAKRRLLAIIGNLPDDDAADVLRALQLLIGVRGRRRANAPKASKPKARQ